MTCQTKTMRMGNTISLIKYFLLGRKPWSEGYGIYKAREINKALHSDALLTQFRYFRALPKRYGLGLDERIIEYPWVIVRLQGGGNIKVLDAGGSMNYDFVMALPCLSQMVFSCLTLMPENKTYNSKFLEVIGDLRHSEFPNEYFDLVVCLSTLEHIGMDTTMYGQTVVATNIQDYKKALLEIRRVVRPRGAILITIPYGKYHNHGWLQQFSHEMVENIIALIAPNSHSEYYYRYTSDGWQIATAEACDSAEHSDVHNYANKKMKCAAAEAVCCIEMRK